MPLWKITAKKDWNWGRDKQLVQGMFIEMTTNTSLPFPLSHPKHRETIANAFNAKYSTNFDDSKMTSSYFTCEKIG